MRFNPLRAFKDPVKRPRMIVWTALALIGFVLLWAGGLVGTSTEWFCTTPCHIVHDDNTLAYHQSTHTHVACVSCHEPLRASPITFTLMKVHVLPDLPATIFKTFELPMNAHNSVALEMPTEQCTQCHNLDNRKVTASKGILIDHKVHTDQGLTCTTCHNRVAHPEENVTFVLEGDRKHENWVKMDGCFRCHSQDDGAKAPGSCEKCHTKKFDLVPSTHKSDDWYTEYGDSSGHARAALEESKTVEEALKFAKEGEEELSSKKLEGPVLKPANAVNSCYTCHKRKFCDDCHGIQIPHPDDFKKTHPKVAYSEMQVCAKCHARSPQEAKAHLGACNACHHPGGSPNVAWRERHPSVVRKQGTGECFKCHEETYCARCHVRVSPTLK